MKSTLSVLIIASYILCCLRLRARPWNYFQINSRHFCRQRGIFSKIALDQMIPAKWRLHQQRLDDAYTPDSFPVFLKPEWGQNSVGIERADNEHQFRTLSRRDGPVRYLVQHAAPEAREFEIFTTFTDESSEQPDYLTVTETVNNTHKYPINGINNVIEINLFTPMPIHLMDEKHSVVNKLRSVLSVSGSLARVTQAMGHRPNAPAVFIRMTLYGRKHQAAQQALLDQSANAGSSAANIPAAGKARRSAVNIHCS